MMATLLPSNTRDKPRQMPRRVGSDAFSRLTVRVIPNSLAAKRCQTQLEQLKRLTTDLAIVFVELFGTRVAPATEM
jgi:hypothetical protein